MASKQEALEALTSAADAISVKALLELQRMSEASPALASSVAAALCMISGSGDSAIQVDPSGLARAAWDDLRALIMKPGHIISAFRNFSYAADGGKVRDNNVQASRSCHEAAAQSTASSEESATAAALQAWTQAAWRYFEVAGGSPRAPTGAREVPAAANGFQSVVPEVPLAAMRPGATKSTRTTTTSAPRRPAAAPKQAAVKAKPATAEVSSRPAPVPVRGSEVSSPKMEAPVLLESPAYSVGGYGATRRKPTHMDIEALRFKLAQLKKDTRAIKGMEASIRWDMVREEEKTKEKMKKKDASEYMSARQEMEQGLQEMAQNVLNDALHKELADRKEYQEFKRAVRHVAHADEKHRQTTEYLEQKDYSEWMADAKRKQHSDQIKQDIEAHLETRNFIAEFRAEERQRQEVEELEDRLEAEHDNLQLAYNKVVQEREEAVDALEYAKACQRVPVPVDQMVPVWYASKT